MTLLDYNRYRKRNLKKDLQKVRDFSSKIEKKLYGTNAITTTVASTNTPPARTSINNHNNDSKYSYHNIKALTPEQLGDLNEILYLANFILTKYEDKKEIHDILIEFVDMINTAAASVEGIDSHIQEMVLEAESTILRIKGTQSGVAAKANLVDDSITTRSNHRICNDK